MDKQMHHCSGGAWEKVQERNAKYEDLDGGQKSFFLILSSCSKTGSLHSLLKSLGAVAPRDYTKLLPCITVSKNHY
jgi:hypothetical protein